MDLERISTSIPTAGPLLLTFVATAALTLVYLASKILQRYRNPPLDIPRIGQVPSIFGNTSKGYFHQHARELLEEGYNKYKHTPYSIWTTNMDRVIVPSEFMPEFNKLRRPDLKLTTTVRHAGQYTGMDIAEQGSLHFTVCASQLSQNIDSLAQPAYDEMKYALAQQLEKAGDSQGKELSINLHALHMQLIAHSTARAFVGPDLCRNADWLENAVQYTREVAQLSSDLDPYWKFLWPVVVNFKDSYRRIRGRFDMAKRLLVPLMDKRAHMKEKPADLLQWMIDTAKGVDATPDMLIKRMLFLNMASIDTTSLTMTNVLLDLMARPHYIDELRTELEEALRSNPDREITASVLHKMDKADSFMKETSRVSPLGYMTLNRQLGTTVKLSNGVILPKDTYLSVVHYFENCDPEIWENPLEFDGHRFSRMRAHAEDTELHRFHSMGKNWPQWGTGKFSCPGRWWASAQIKLVLITLLLNFDVSYPDGQTERPPNTPKGESSLPSFTQNILLRRRAPPAGLEDLCLWV